MRRHSSRALLICGLLSLGLGACGGEEPAETEAVTVSTPESEAASGDVTVSQTAPEPAKEPAAAETPLAIPLPQLDDTEEDAVYRQALEAGMQLLRAGEYPEAIIELNRALDVHADDPQVHRMLGNAYASNRQSERAIEAFGTAIELNPEYPATHYELARLALSDGNIELAGRESRRTLELDPGNPRAQELAGMIAHHQGDHEEAIRILKPFVDSLKETAFPEVYLLEAQYFLGLTYKDQGSFDEARQVLEEVPLSSPYYKWGQEALRLMIMEERKRR